MIVILVNFTVDGGCGLLMMSLGNCLIDDSWSDFLVDSGVMVTRLVPEGRCVSSDVAPVDGGWSKEKAKQQQTD